MGLKEELKEREKELDCLYRLTPLFTSYEGSEGPLLQTVGLELKIAMTWPDFTVVDLELENADRKMAVVKAGKEPYFQAECLLANGDSLTVRLAFTRPDKDLVPRERVLLESVLRLTAVTLERLRNEKALSGKNMALTELLNHLEDEREKNNSFLSTKINTFIFPLLNQMEQSLDEREGGRIKLIRNVLQELTVRPGKNLQKLFPVLTPRELEICGLISTGNSTKNISDLLGISTQTVERHRCTIRKKLGITGTGKNLGSFLINL